MSIYNLYHGEFLIKYDSPSRYDNSPLSYKQEKIHNHYFDYDEEWAEQNPQDVVESVFLR